MTRAELADKIERKLGRAGRMLSKSKTAADNEVVLWNAVLYNPEGQRLWAGDFNLTTEQEKLEIVAREARTPILIAPPEVAEMLRGKNDAERRVELGINKQIRWIGGEHAIKVPLADVYVELGDPLSWPREDRIAELETKLVRGLLAVQRVTPAGPIQQGSTATWQVESARQLEMQVVSNPVAQIFRFGPGDERLAANRYVLKLMEALSPDGVRIFLNANGLDGIRSLAFSPNLLLVALRGALVPDTIATLRQFSGLPEVEMIEPDWVSFTTWGAL